ncbi:Prolyl oligopeptidase [Xylanimonas cellulosilytica DSM 15894]|uniref:Prolyl oligopeptidase n=1 Tax=Xylanimonas cellulosilytica (strain DSM 15894 / JCM 12276 / CECT 5975 / KCTC 9989 / LMG 20990 / NBRC 107835 / XIL07) TaxID=446471 RepID=D1BVV2_XYLCX|nr:prolyl oligopeptidase family serine peptidase [Xylanimonas cellulosilytica]ACZ31421.1 Prolyl oligopeptidase [Xylanimonas cellulosilytica DSM 15894]
MSPAADHDPVPSTPLDPGAVDPYGWLEDVEGPAALAWVRERNAHAHRSVGSGAGFETTEKAILEVLDSDARIPDVSRIGDHLYNFWRDGAHPRGLWRRTTLSSYRTDSPEWEEVLDLDALAEAEDTAWVWHGASLLRPTPEQLAAGQPWRRALIDLSVAGSDADVTREFDVVTRAFVPAPEGFERAEAKGGLAWADEDTVYVFTDLGPGTTTTSGYPRTVRLWRRGTALDDASVVFEGRDDDLYISGRRSRTPGFERDIVHRSIAFYRSETFLVSDVGTPAQALRRIEVPESAEVGLHREWLLVELRDPWAAGGHSYPAGALLAAPVEEFLAGSRDLAVLFEPTPTTSLAGATWTRHHLVLNVLDDVVNRLHVLTPPTVSTGSTTGEGVGSTTGEGVGSTTGEGGEWVRSSFPTTDPVATVGVRAVDPLDSDDVWVVTSGYLTPSTLSLATIGSPDAGLDPLKAAPSFFDAAGLAAEQHFATSDDGTRVPYFVVGRADVLHRPRHAEPRPTPTLLYGYGGFEISLTPSYSGGLGRAWLERGGVYAVANIRGGGEYGPSWHQAALGRHRHRAYEDFAAVARDLVQRGITTPAHLGVQGGSNGGLLAGNMLVRHPDLFGAVVIQVPLLDMKRYSHLLAGASWMAEYGDPDDPEQWAHLRQYSPYHHVTDGVDYPPVLLLTSTRDDRVHPGHARKMAALLDAVGADVTYYENIEGGHGGAATNAQAAHMAALAWEFLAQRLGAA